MDIGEERGLRRVEGGGGPQGCRDDDASWRAAGRSHAKRNFKKKKRQFGIITPIMLHRDGGSTSSRHQRLPPFVYPSQVAATATQKLPFLPWNGNETWELGRASSRNLLSFPSQDAIQNPTRSRRSQGLFRSSRLPLRGSQTEPSPALGSGILSGPVPSYHFAGAASPSLVSQDSGSPR